MNCLIIYRKDLSFENDFFVLKVVFICCFRDKEQRASFFCANDQRLVRVQLLGLRLRCDTKQASLI